MIWDQHSHICYLDCADFGKDFANSIDNIFELCYNTFVL